MIADPEPVISNAKHPITAPDGIAVDWIYQHIYWTDTNQKTVSVADYSGNMSKTIVSNHTEAPRSIVVDPEKG